MTSGIASPDGKDRLLHQGVCEYCRNSFSIAVDTEHIRAGLIALPLRLCGYCQEKWFREKALADV